MNVLPSLPPAPKSFRGKLGWGLRSLRKYLATPLLVLCLSALLLLISRLIYDHYAPIGKDTWKDFWDNWGAALGVGFTVLLGALVVLFPSRLEKKLDEQTAEIEEKLDVLRERLGGSLNNFPEICERASQLLKELNTAPNTSFKMISATPILGLELGEAHTNLWWSLLASRIEAGCETEIVCLDPRSTSSRPRPPLAIFCKTLAEKYLTEKDRGRVNGFEGLYNSGRQQIEAFLTKYSAKQCFTLKWGDDPPFQIIIARNAQGISKCIFYFASNSTLERGLDVLGFLTEDARMGDVLDRVFKYVSDSADRAEDLRTPRQRDRDFELQSFWERNRTDRSITVPEIAPNFELIVRQGIFPPDIALAKGAFDHAIVKSANRVWNQVPAKNRVGIDIGTGTGGLALLLAKHCPLVIATDIGSREIANAKLNFENYRKQVNTPTEFKALECNLFDKVPDLGAEKVPLIVFNHPYYPSPSNVFNVGGGDAGLPLIQPFLEKAREYVSRGGGVIMPYSEIAEKHRPVDVALSLDYETEIVDEKSDEKYGKHFIYLFTPRIAHPGSSRT